MGLDLLDLIEADAVAALDLLRLVGVDSPADVTAAAFIGIVGQCPHRLNEALTVLEHRGWTVSPSSAFGGFDLVPPPTLPSLVAIEAGGEVLRDFFLWALCRTTGEDLLDGQLTTGSYDLHARHADSGGERRSRLPVLDPEEALALIRSAGSPLTRAAAVLQLLPSLRDRLVLTLRFGLEVESEAVISVLCDSDPAGAEFGDPSRAGAAEHQEAAMTTLRSTSERARRRIEDSLNSGHAGLLALVDGARSARLPRWASSVLADWTGAWKPSPRGWRRAESMARLIWMRGPESPEETLRQSLVPPTQLTEAEHGLWRWATEDEYRFPERFEVFGVAGPPDVVTAFLLRYVCWRQGRERPSRTTLGEVLLGLPPDRATGEQIGRGLTAARAALIGHLDRETKPPGPPRSDLMGGAATDWLLGRRRRGGERPRSTERERSDFSRDLRRRVGQAAPPPATRKTSKWQSLGARLVELLPPRWTLRPGAGLRLDLLGAGALASAELRGGDRVRLRIQPSEELDRLHPVVIRETAGQAHVIHPPDANLFPSLGEFPLADDGAREITVTLARHAGPHRYIVAFCPTDALVDPEAPTSTRWEWLRRGVEAGRVPAAEVWVVVRARP